MRFFARILPRIFLAYRPYGGHTAVWPGTLRPGSCHCDELLRHNSTPGRESPVSRGADACPRYSGAGPGVRMPGRDFRCRSGQGSPYNGPDPAMGGPGFKNRNRRRLRFLLTGEPVT